MRVFFNFCGFRVEKCASAEPCDQLMDIGYKQKKLREKFCKDFKNRVNKIPFVLTYNKNLVNLIDLLERNWNIPRINQNYHLIFNNMPFFAYRINKNLQDLHGRKNIFNGKVVRTNNKFNKTGYSSL